jgi:hypothetical protein
MDYGFLIPVDCAGSATGKNGPTSQKNGLKACISKAGTLRLHLNEVEQGDSVSSETLFRVRAITL